MASSHVSSYLYNVLQSSFANLPHLISKVAQERRIGNDEAINYVENEIKNIIAQIKNIPQNAQRSRVPSVMDAQQREITALRAEVEFVKRIYNETIEKKRDDSREVSQLKAKIALLQEELTKCNKKYSLSKSQLNEALMELAEGNKEVSTRAEKYEKRAERYERKARSLEDELNMSRGVLEENKTKLRRQREEYRTQIRQQTERLAKLEQALKSNNDALSYRDTRLLELVRIIEPDNQDPSTAMERIASYLQQYINMTKTIEDLQTLEHKHRERIARLMDTIASKAKDEPRILELTEVMTEQTRQLNELQTELAQSKALLEQCQRNLKQSEYVLGEQVKERDRSIAALTERCKQAESSTEQRAGEQTALYERVTEHEETIARLNANIRLQEETIKRAEARIQERQRKIEDCSMRYEELWLGYTQKKVDLTRMTSKNAELQMELDELKAVVRNEKTITDALAQAVAMYRNRGDANVLALLTSISNGQDISTNSVILQTPQPTGPSMPSLEPTTTQGPIVNLTESAPEPAFDGTKVTMGPATREILNETIRERSPTHPISKQKDDESDNSDDDSDSSSSSGSSNGNSSSSSSSSDDDDEATETEKPIETQELQTATQSVLKRRRAPTPSIEDQEESPAQRQLIEPKRRIREATLPEEEGSAMGNEIEDDEIASEVILAGSGAPSVIDASGSPELPSLSSTWLDEFPSDLTPITTPTHRPPTPTLKPETLGIEETSQDVADDVLRENQRPDIPIFGTVLHDQAAVSLLNEEDL